MPRLTIRVEQSLLIPAPGDDGQIADALDTIRDPDPYLSDEPFAIDFSFEVESAEAVLENKQIRARRVLTLRFDFQDTGEAVAWLINEGMSDPAVTDVHNQVLESIDPERFATTIVSDFEGCIIGNEMIDFESDYTVLLEP